MSNSPGNPRGPSLNRESGSLSNRDQQHPHAFGHGLQAWTIYQRVVLRLPYEIITQVMDDLFGIGLGTSTLVYFVGNLAGYYAPTEASILRAILKSDSVHVDETKINIRSPAPAMLGFTADSIDG